jgi:hypothetical protein
MNPDPICTRYEGFYLMPLLFSPAMVRANIDGLKLCTRRHRTSPIYQKAKDALESGTQVLAWVREEWCASYADPANPDGAAKDYFDTPREKRLREFRSGYWYRADEELKPVSKRYVPPRRWVPPMHMPFDQHRMFMRVRSIKLSRLGDMSEEDAIEEGMGALIGRLETGFNPSALDVFRTLWVAMHGTWSPDETVWRIRYDRPMQGPVTEYISIEQEIAA